LHLDCSSCDYLTLRISNDSADLSLTKRATYRQTRYSGLDVDHGPRTSSVLGPVTIRTAVGVEKHDLSSNRFRWHQIGSNGIAAKVFHLVLLRQEDFPMEHVNGHIHLRQGQFRAALLRKRSARVHEDKRNIVQARGTEAGPQQGHAIAIRAFNGFHFLSRD